MKNDISEILIVSDVSERNGIGVEIYVEHELVVEIFRDDTNKSSSITLFRKEISLELMEACIEIFKKEIPSDFTE